MVRQCSQHAPSGGQVLMWDLVVQMHPQPHLLQAVAALQTPAEMTI